MPILFACPAARRLRCSSGVLPIGHGLTLARRGHAQGCPPDIYGHWVKPSLALAQMSTEQADHPINPVILRKQLLELGRNTDWLAERLQLSVETVEGWLAGRVPDEGLTIKLKLDGGEDASTILEYSLDEYLELEMQAADLGLNMAEMLEKAVIAWREECEKRPPLPRYTKEGNIIRVDFGRKVGSSSPQSEL